MPLRETAPVGAPCWVDLMTSDVERSRAFYTRLLGWVAEDGPAEFGGYVNFTKDGIRVAGCMPSQPGSGVSDVWNVYLATDDARKTVEAAATNGGEVRVPAMPVGDLGSMAYLGDPDGANVGIWQPGQHAGFGAYGEPGTPSWFELYTRDYEAALRFYRDVFGWDTHTLSDTAEFRYTTMKQGEDWLAGVMDATAFLPEGVPSHWTVYFGVADTDATLTTAVDLGGAVVTPAEDTPYGRIATVSDPTGALFRLVAANDAMPAKDPAG